MYPSTPTIGAHLRQSLLVDICDCAQVAGLDLIVHLGVPAAKRAHADHTHPIKLYHLGPPCTWETIAGPRIAADRCPVRARRTSECLNEGVPEMSPAYHTPSRLSNQKTVPVDVRRPFFSASSDQEACTERADYSESNCSSRIAQLFPATRAVSSRLSRSRCTTCSGAFGQNSRCAAGSRHPQIRCVSSSISSAIRYLLGIQIDHPFQRQVDLDAPPTRWSAPVPVYRPGHPRSSAHLSPGAPTCRAPPYAG